jgi:hypothetical protein
MDRRKLLTGGAAMAAIGATAAACSAQSDGNTGTDLTQNAGSVNDLAVQQGELSYKVWNQLKADPSQAYPLSLLHSSQELHQQREKLLRFNQKTKTGWAYLFSPNGELIAELPVLGKVSSTQSSMTTSVGVYSSTGSGGGGNVVIELPGDDGSFGKNEGGDMGKFFFTPDAVYIYWDGPILYADARLENLANTVKLNLPSGAKPSSIAESSTLFND